MIIRAQNLLKRYGELVAVDEIDFDIERGEAIGLLGPNGAGKTTTISMLVGLLEPDSGTVTINDSGSPQQPELRKLIGIAPQKLSLYEELTAKENLTFFSRLHVLSSSQTRQRVSWCLEFAGLSDRANDLVRNYSGGMQRRLNLASALVHEPEIVLLDEPTVGVDPQSRNHLFEKIEHLKEQGVTILYTTHYMEEAQRLCDRVAIMDHGKILDIDKTESLLQRHGGRSVVTAIVDELPTSLKSDLKLHDGNQLRLESTDPVEQISSLHREGLRFSSLQIKQPDLESVFLKLTGRSLRDE